MLDFRQPYCIPNDSAVLAAGTFIQNVPNPIALRRLSLNLT